MHARVRLDPRFPTAVPPGAQCLLWGPGDELHPHYGSCKQIHCSDGGPPGGLCIETPQYGYTNGSAVAFPLYRSGFTVDLVNASNCTVSDVHILAASTRSRGTTRRSLILIRLASAQRAASF